MGYQKPDRRHYRRDKSADGTDPDWSNIRQPSLRSVRIMQVVWSSLRLGHPRIPLCPGDESLGQLHDREPASALRFGPIVTSGKRQQCPVVAIDRYDKT